MVACRAFHPFAVLHEELLIGIYIYLYTRYLTNWVAGAVFNLFCGKRSPSHACGCKQNSRNFFKAHFGSFLYFFAKSIYEQNFATFWVISIWYFAHCVWWFSFFLFHFFLLGGYLIKIDDIFSDISSIQNQLRYLGSPYWVYFARLSLFC